MNITCLTQWFSPEPDSSRGLPFAKWLQNRGHKVTVLTGFPNYPSGVLYPGYQLRARQWDEIDGVAVLRVPLYPSHDRSALRRATNYLSFAASAALIGLPSIRKTDVIYVMNTPPTAGLPALLAHTFSDIPYVFNVADIWPEAVLDSGMVTLRVMNRMLSPMLNALCRTVYGGARFVTAISRGYKRILVERGLAEENVHAVYNWVDENMIRPEPRDDEVAARLGLEGRFNIVYAGNMGLYQDPHTVVRTAALLRHIPEIQLVFVGGGLLQNEIRAHANELGLTNVKFIDAVHVCKMAAIYSLADVLLIHLIDRPFLRATVPGKTQASLAAGRPIIAACEGESADIVREARAGLTCRPQDEGALAACIEQLYRATSSDLQDLGRRGREFYLANMSLEVSAPRIEKLLQQATV